MATSEATIVEAGGRELRVSSPDRVIFPATERPAAITKLDVVEYYLAVGDGIMRALRAAADDARALAEGRARRASSLSTREKGGGDAFFQKRIPRGAPDYVETARIEFPSGRHADEICPTEIAVVGWAAQMGTITFHPWPVRARRRRPPRRAAPRPRPAAGHRLRRRRARRRRGARRCSASSATPASRRPRAAAASTSTSGSSRAGRSPTSATRRSRSGASSSGGCPGEVTTKWWKEERGERIFVDYNQNARDRTIASAYSVRPKPGAPVSAPVTWDELAERRARGLHGRDDAGALRRGRRPPRARSTTPPTRCSRCSTCTSATRPRAAATCPTRPTTRRCRASPSACSRRATATGRATERRPQGACGSLLRRRACATGADGGGTTGPDVAVRRLVEVDDHRRVVARAPCPCAPGGRPRRPAPARRPAPPASTRSIRIPRSWWNIPAR